MTSSQCVDAFLHRLHRAARRLPADEREELLIGLGARAEQIRAQGLDPSATATALDRLGDPDAIVADALGSAARPRFRPRFVVWTLAAAWLSILVALTLGYALSSPDLILLVMAASGLSQLGALLVLILSLVGTMWHRWRDTFATLALLVAANAAVPMMFAALGSNNNCDQATDGLTPCSVTAAGLTWRAVLAVVLAAAVLASLHWVLQLIRLRRPDYSAPSRPTVAAVAIGGAALLMLAYLATGPVGPAGTVTGRVTNDTGHDVRVTICPKQDCTGQPTTNLANGDHIDLATSDASIPDSVVVQATGHPTVCLLAEPALTSNDPARFSGTLDMPIGRAADTETCGADVASLDKR